MTGKPPQGQSTSRPRRRPRRRTQIPGAIVRLWRKRVDSMAEREFQPPVEEVDGSFRLNFKSHERELIVRLLDELKDLLDSEASEATAPLLHRLFPPAFHDDPEKEAEYQRLMREELVKSRLAAIAGVTTMLTPDDDGRLDTLSESETMAFMQSVNAIRLVLGTMLDITDDESAEDADLDDSPEHNLYSYLGWILEWTVRALSGDTSPI